MRILLTGFIRPSDLMPYFDHSSLDSAAIVSTLTNPGVPLSDLVADLIDLGHEVTVVTSNSRISETLVLTGNNLKVVILPKGKSPRIRSLLFHIPEIARTLKLLKSEEFDVIHSHWGGELTLAALLYDRNTIVTFHDNPWLIFSKNRKISNFVRVIIFILVFILSRNIVVVSASLGLEYPFKLRKRSLKCIPNSVRIGTLLPPTKNLEVESSRKTFLMVAGQEKYKNRNIFLESLSLLSNIDPIEIVIVSGSDSKSVEEISAKVSLRLTGPLSRKEMATEINRAYCVVHLSQIESFSLITAEARTLGVPLIIGKQCTAVIYTAGPSAFQVDGNSQVEVAKAISKLANDSTLHSSCIGAYASAGEDIFSNQILLNGYLNLYRDH